MRLSSYFTGDGGFYRKVASIAIPLGLQQLLNNSMGIVDSAMVSRIGGITAVGMANNVVDISNSVFFGVTTGISIYLTQYFGAGRVREQQQIFSLGIWTCTGIGLLFILAVQLFGQQLMGFYVSDPGIISQSLLYLRIVAFSLIPSSLVTMFSCAYRAAQKTTIPFVIGMIGAAAKCLLNYLLIFGNFGFPALGLRGAAISTLTAHCLNLLLHILFARRTRQAFIGGILSARDIPLLQLKAVSARALPLVINETIFGFGNTMYIKAFNNLGAAALESYYIGNQVVQVFNSIISGIQNAVGAILGNILGRNEIEKAKEQGEYFVGISLVLSVITVGIIYVFARPIAGIFSVSSPQVFENAVAIVRIFSIKIALRMFIVLVFACLRAGGDSKFLVFLDSGIMWFLGIPLTYLCVYGFHLESITQVFLIIQLEQVVRLALGMHHYKKGAWLNNLTETKP